MVPTVHTGETEASPGIPTDRAGDWGSPRIDTLPGAIRAMVSRYARPPHPERRNVPNESRHEDPIIVEGFFLQPG
jgi:hypothetical protein